MTLGGPSSIRQMADDAARVLVARKATPAHVVGISMGGYIAQTLALARPELVRSLVLLGTSCGGPDALPVPEDTLRQWLANAGRPPEEYARATMHLSFSPGWSDRNPERYEELLRARLEYPTPPEAWRAQYAAAEEFLADGVDAEQIAVPTLVLHGDQDRVVPIENGRALARRVPGARFGSLSGCGHVAQLENPTAFNDAVIGFAEAVEA